MVDLFMIRKALKQRVSWWYLRGREIGWKTPLPHVLIERVPGYSERAWECALDAEFVDWRERVEIQFVRHFAERDILGRDAHAYVSTGLSSAFLTGAPDLRWVQLVTGGADCLEGLAIPPDVQITTATGIAATGIAEHVLMLMLALDRRLDIALAQQRRWVWRQREILPRIHGLRGRTVGVVGLGNNGRAVAGLAAAIGMKVIGVRRRPDPDAGGVAICKGGLPELLASADFVVLCVPLTAETRHLIGREDLATMPRAAYLINVARGEVVDDSALAWALRNGTIAGAALDVLSAEPPPRFHPLRGCPNLIITPHVAGNIHTFREEIQRRFARNLKAFVDGRPLEGVHQQARVNV